MCHNHKNGSFETLGSLGPFASFTGQRGYVASATADWSIANNYGGTTNTTLVNTSALPVAEPFSGGQRAIRIQTTSDGVPDGGEGSGIYQYFPNTNNLSAWVIVDSGQATVSEFAHTTLNPARCSSTTPTRWLC